MRTYRELRLLRVELRGAVEELLSAADSLRRRYEDLEARVARIEETLAPK